MQLWGSRFVNADGDTFDMSVPGVVDVRGRRGDFSALPFDIKLDESPDGSQAAPVGVKFDRGVLTIPAGIRAPEGSYLRTYVDSIRSIMRPWQDEDTPNRGYLYIDRISGLAAAQTWRIAVVPLPFVIEITNSRDREAWYETEFRFRALANGWEIDPATANRGTLSPAGAWSAHSVTLNPAGDMVTFPTWEFDGPASGQIDTLQIANNTTGKVFELTNGALALSSGERLIVSTGFMEKGAKIYTINGDGSTGALLEDVYWRRSHQSEFWTLRPASQSITFTKNASSTSVIRASYRRRVYGII